MINSKLRWWEESCWYKPRYYVLVPEWRARTAKAPKYWDWQTSHWSGANIAVNGDVKTGAKFIKLPNTLSFSFSIRVSFQAFNIPK